jgi:hypothetical protein
MTPCLRLSSGGGFTPTQTTNLSLLEDLDDVGGPEEPSPASLVGWGETEISFRESVPRRG